MRVTFQYLPEEKIKRNGKNFVIYYQFYLPSQFYYFVTDESFLITFNSSISPQFSNGLYQRTLSLLAFELQGIMTFYRNRGHNSLG